MNSQCSFQPPLPPLPPKCCRLLFGLGGRGMELNPGTPSVEGRFFFLNSGYPCDFGAGLENGPHSNWYMYRVYRNGDSSLFSHDAPWKAGSDPGQFQEEKEDYLNGNIWGGEGCIPFSWKREVSPYHQATWWWSLSCCTVLWEGLQRQIGTQGESLGCPGNAEALSCLAVLFTALCGKAGRKPFDT